MEKRDELRTNADGTVYDPNTGLLWQSDTQWSDMRWDDATKLEGMVYVNSAIIAMAGLTSNSCAWRLPTYDELKSLSYTLWEYEYPAGKYNDGRDDNFFQSFRDNKRKFFPHLKPTVYWSRTTDSSRADAAMGISFADMDIAVTVHSLKYMQQGVLFVLGRKDVVGAWL